MSEIRPNKKSFFSSKCLAILAVCTFALLILSPSSRADFSNNGSLSGWSVAEGVNETFDGSNRALELSNGSFLAKNASVEQPFVALKFRFPQGDASPSFSASVGTSIGLEIIIDLRIFEGMLDVHVVSSSSDGALSHERLFSLEGINIESQYFRMAIKFSNAFVEISIRTSVKSLGTIVAGVDEGPCKLARISISSSATNTSRADGHVLLDDVTVSKNVEENENITELVTRIAFLLAIVLLAAKLTGEVFEKYLKVPSVLGELVAGMIIGPYALGGLAIPIGGFSLGPIFDGPIFNPVGDTPQTSIILYAFAQIGAVVLLFVAGLETNPDKFLSAGKPGAAIAMGGVLVPFALGYVATVLYNGDPIAGLFMGAILTATSVGITARVLSDIKKLNTPEGIMILCAAVIDDVIGIIVLVVVVGIVTTGTVSPVEIALVAIKAVVFWGAMLFVGLRYSHVLRKMLGKLTTAGGSFGLAFVLCLFAAFLAESVGLAMIIGAYALGLAFAKLDDVAEKLREQVYSLYHTMVPVFFVVMGMLVDLRSMLPVLGFGLVISLLAVVGKVIGTGGVSLLGNFNRTGAARIGIGMIPRGEVALIVASYALVLGAIGTDLYGVAIIMTAITTFVTPVLLVKVFTTGGEGTKPTKNDNNRVNE